ncbi:MAG TPA: ABC transporter permease, partial [Candidatus Solibacter sp.]|nr:ABC transporter permease [Candidatus Solibacter sp.]
MFGIFRAVLLNPIPYADPDRVVAIQTRFIDTGRQIPRVTGGDLTDIVQARDVFETVGRYNGGLIGVQLRQRAEWANTYFVNPGFFDAFDVVPLRGRALSAQDARRSAAVSSEFANRAFGGIDLALGQVLQIDKRSYQVVGVMPPGFNFPDKAGIWAADNEA